MNVRGFHGQEVSIISETTTVKSNSNEQLEQSVISNLSRDSGERCSIKSFKSQNEDNRSFGEGSLCKTLNLSAKHSSAKGTSFEKNPIVLSNRFSPVLQASTYFNPLIATELRAKHLLTRKAFYTELCSLMIQHSSSADYFHRPIKERLYLPNMVISRVARVEPEEILTQLMTVENQVDFLFFLKVFFLNIYEFVLDPLKVLLLLLQEFFFEPNLNFSASERKAIRDRMTKGIKDRILLFLQTWITKREKDFLFGKAEMLETVLEGPVDFEARPAQSISPSEPDGSLTWLVDKAAATRLSRTGRA